MSASPILTTAQMRRAEEQAVAGGTSVGALMEKAGTAVAAIARRFSGNADTLILCGPGNNGGDGYVAARALAAAGVQVRVAASAPPATEVAAQARRAWGGAVEALEDARSGAVLVDALFGTGLKRSLDPSVNAVLHRFSDSVRTRIAVDLPSGVESDSGALLSPVPAFDLTVVLGALKPAHLLQPAAALMGRLVVADIGVPVSSALTRIGRPSVASPGPRDHKYTRGLVAVLAGDMPGAARLAALGAARAGAGYVEILGDAGCGLPAAIVARDDPALEHLADARIGALVVGPGLGRGPRGEARLDAALSCGRPLVLDADALWHLGGRRLAGPAILTPHEAEFTRAFGDFPGDKISRARQAAEACGAVVVLKGADTIVAAPDGRAALGAIPVHDLATAGTGDMLAGVCGTMLAQLRDPFAAACAAVWLHAAAARSLGGPFIADDLAAALPSQVALCR